MALTGSFKETSFADLLQLYSISKQTVAVSVTLSGSDRADGVFYFDRGDLVGAFLSGTEGREAIRRALRLHDGKFRVEGNVKPPEAAVREALQGVVMEELVHLDEENRGSGATATTKASWAAATGGPARPPAEPAPAKAAAAAAPPPRPAPPPKPPSGAAPPSKPAAPPPPPEPPAKGKGPLLAVAAVVVLAGAGAAVWLLRGGDAPPPAPAAPPPAAAAASAPAAPPAGPAVRGVTEGEVLLGMVASFSGSNKERGRAMRLGWETAIAAANAAGGVNGRQVRLVAYDDGYDPARTLPAMKEVLEGQRAFAVVGNVGTATSAVAIPYAAEQKAVFFGALSGADLLRKSPPDRHVFNYRASLASEAAAAVRYLVEVRRIPAARIAVLAQDDDFGASGFGGAARQLEGYGVGKEAILKLAYARNTADVREALRRLEARREAYDAVVLVATYKPAATFIRKARDAGLRIVPVTVSADSSGLAEELVQSGPRYAQDVVVTQVVPVPTSGATSVIKFRRQLEAHAPGEKPGSTTLEAWIGAQIFLEALRRAGPELDTDRLVKALEGIQNWDMGIGAPITLGPNDHQASDKVWGWRLAKDGTWAPEELE